MSEELRLPDDLAAYEARLAAHALPASGIDRDQLLYRAGWAACEAKLTAIGDSIPLPRREGLGEGFMIDARPKAVRRHATLLSSFTSPALAAALAVAATLQFQPRPEVPARENTADAIVASPTPEVANRILPPPAFGRHLATTTETLRSTPRSGLQKTSMLALRLQAAAGDVPASDEEASSAADFQRPRAQTARELMRELLPPAPARSARVSPWGLGVLGDVI